MDIASPRDTERRPLLRENGGSHLDPGTASNQFGRFSFSRSSLSNIFQARSRDPYDNGDGDDDDDDHNQSDVDVDELRLDLALVGSLPSGAGSEFSRPYNVPYRRPSRLTKSTSIVTPTEVDPVTIREVTHEGPVAVYDPEEGDPRFINISPKRFWVIFAVIILAYFVACFDSTLMASSHPVITSYFHASEAASWLSTVFLITSTAFQPLFGRLSDTVGRKSVFLLSLTIFLLTTLWCSLAGSIESFIAARAVCGLGAGGTMSLGLIMISDLVRIEHRGIFQSHINVAFGLGSASGAAFGGYLCDSLGWRWSFGVQVPVLALCLLLAALASPRDLGPMLIKQGQGSAMLALKSFDYLGSLLLITAITTLILALNLGGNVLPWGHPIVIACVITFVVAAGLFVLIELRAKQPLMPLQLLTRAPVANLVFANFLGGIASNTVLFNVPLFFQAVLLTSASDSGFRLAVPNLCGALAGVSTGYIITYTRALKPTLSLGAAIYLIGAVLVLLLKRSTPAAVSLVLITGVPVGQGFVFPNTMMSALAVSEQPAQAVVTTTIGLWRNLGTVMGVAVSSLIFQNALVGNLKEMVTGPRRDEIVAGVRASVESIRGLEPGARMQVTSAYAASLHSAFWCALVAAVLINVLVLPVRLPRLTQGVKIMAPAGE